MNRPDGITDGNWYTDNVLQFAAKILAKLSDNKYGYVVYDIMAFHEFLEKYEPRHKARKTYRS